MFILLLFWGGVAQAHVGFIYAIFIFVKFGARDKVSTQQRLVEQIALHRMSHGLVLDFNLLIPICRGLNGDFSKYIPTHNLSM